jgi:hypothetical protein
VRTVSCPEGLGKLLAWLPEEKNADGAAHHDEQGAVEVDLMALPAQAGAQSPEGGDFI